jgi:hypothetical protein
LFQDTRTRDALLLYVNPEIRSGAFDFGFQANAWHRIVPMKHASRHPIASFTRVGRRNFHTTSKPNAKNTATRICVRRKSRETGSKGLLFFKKTTRSVGLRRGRRIGDDIWISKSFKNNSKNFL